MRTICLAIVTLMLTVSTAGAQFDLQVTELWMGNEPGSNLTADWIEITNVGSTAWVESVDGMLWFEDNSVDPMLADVMGGIASIAAGESVLFLNGADPNVDSSDIDEFMSVWANVQLPQIGFHDGSGLGQGGDGAAIFIGPDVNNLILLDFEEYPDANASGGQSWDVLLGAFSSVGNANGALASSTANDMGQFAIASIGPAAIPEPGTLSLIGLIGLGLANRRRR